MGNKFDRLAPIIAEMADLMKQRVEIEQRLNQLTDSMQNILGTAPREASGKRDDAPAAGTIPRQILNYMELEAPREVTLVEVAEAVGKKPNATSAHLSRLAAAGFVKRGSRRGTFVLTFPVQQQALPVGREEKVTH